MSEFQSSSSQTYIAPQTSATIYGANVIATLLVIALHYKSNRVLTLDQANTANYLFQEFLAVGMGSSAVPFFAFFSGFFSRKSWYSQRGRQFFLGKLRNIVLPYLIASAVISASLIGMSFVLPELQGYRESALREVAKIFIKPRSVQFWYLRDLIILTALSPLLFFPQKSWFKLGLSTILCCIWLSEIQIFPKIAGWYFLHIESLLFFWLGGTFYQQRHKLKGVQNAQLRTKILIFACWFILIGIRISVQSDISLWYQNNSNWLSLLLHKAAILMGLPALYISGYHIRAMGFVHLLRKHTFFAYLFHFQPLFTLLSPIDQMMPLQWVFYLKFPLALCVIFGGAMLLDRNLPWLYVVITGGRSNKAISSDK